MRNKIRNLPASAVQCPHCQRVTQLPLGPAKNVAGKVSCSNCGAKLRPGRRNRG